MTFAVLVPESFRGGCSFGVGKTDLSRKGLFAFKTPSHVLLSKQSSNSRQLIVPMVSVPMVFHLLPLGAFPHEFCEKAANSIPQGCPRKRSGIERRASALIDRFAGQGRFQIGGK